MERLTIKILGNGGCLNNGLPYNASILNGHFLIEAPPDIMLSLQTSHIAYEKIDTIFISHLHGDHAFGLPFLIISMWMKSLQASKQASLTILGPDGIEGYVQKLTEIAFTTSHPCYAWLEENIMFNIIHKDFEMTSDDLTLSCFDVRHLIETYGFLLSVDNRHIFAYIADTRWCPQVERILGGKPKVVLMDMNGGDQNIHVSLPEVVEKGLPITGSDVVIYGTHLVKEFESRHGNIRCAKPGEEIVITHHRDTGDTEIFNNFFSAHPGSGVSET